MFKGSDPQPRRRKTPVPGSEEGVRKSDNDQRQEDQAKSIVYGLSSIEIRPANDRCAAPSPLPLSRWERGYSRCSRETRRIERGLSPPPTGRGVGVRERHNDQWKMGYSGCSREVRRTKRGLSPSPTGRGVGVREQHNDQ